MKVNSFKSILVFLFLVFVTEVCFADLEYGLGANFVVKNNKLIVYGVYCGAPAHKYGLQSGDVIVKYNEVVVSDIYNFFINNFITGNLLSNKIKKEEEKKRY